MGMENLGKIIVGLGLILVVVGLAVWFLGDKLGWLGNLPGDIRVERPGFSFYMPCATMILFSLVLSIVLSVISRFLR
jgi:hypothetical protein